jgi:hypothetical protein
VRVILSIFYHLANGSQLLMSRSELQVQAMVWRRNFARFASCEMCDAEEREGDLHTKLAGPHLGNDERSILQVRYSRLLVSSAIRTSDEYNGAIIAGPNQPSSVLL